MLDGRHTGTGGGNHIVLGGPTPADSPFLRRPDLLRSLVAYWNNHPSLSYLFSGTVHRTHEPGAARRRSAARQPVRTGDRVPADSRSRQDLSAVAGRSHLPQSADRRDRQHASRRVLHRQALFARYRQRAGWGWSSCARFEMPPHARMSLTQQLLLRALIARFWKQPYRERPGPLGHRRCTIGSCCRTSSAQDFADVIAELQQAGYRIRAGMVRAAFRVSLPALSASVRHAGREARAAAGDRAVERAGRRAGRRRHGALRRFVGRAAAGEGRRY